MAGKLLYTLGIIFTDPGKLKKDSRVEKYFKTNRKDLANVKAPMNLGTPSLRSNFCYTTKCLYARYETHSYMFMCPIAARNAAFYYMFYLNEVVFCTIYLAMIILNLGTFWPHNMLKLLVSTIVFIVYFFKMYYDYKRIWVSLRDNITITERVNAHKNPVFLQPGSTFFNPFDRGFVTNAKEFFIP